MATRNAFENLSTEAKQQIIIDKLVELKTELAEKLEAGQIVTLDSTALAALESVSLNQTSLDALENITVGGTVGLTQGALDALENITVGGTVGLSQTTLDALETISVGGTVGLTQGALDALEQISATVSGSVSLTQSSLDALEQITVTLSNTTVSLSQTTLDALEQITASISGTVTVAGTVAVSSVGGTVATSGTAVGSTVNQSATAIVATGISIAQQTTAERWLSIQLVGTFVGTVQLQGSNDGTTWIPLSVTPIAGGTSLSSLTVAGIWMGPVPTRYWRVQTTAYTSGTINIYVNASNAPIAHQVDTEIGNPGTLADAAGNPTIAALGSYLFGYNSGATNWDRVRTGAQLAVSGKIAAAIGLPPLTSLNAVTAVGAGTAQDFGVAFSNWAIQVIHTGSPTQVKVALELSLNGTNWWQAGVWDLTAGPQANGDIVSVLNRPATRVRANLLTLTAGTTPTVTALIVGVP